MVWGLSPEETKTSNETTIETNESRFVNSPKLEDDNDIFHPYRRCNLVHNEKQLADVRERVTKTNFSSLNQVN